MDASSSVLSTNSSVSLPSLPVVSTCITTCKKAAPPPVPPRTTSKPYISVTVQSSTESAQDTYLDGQDRKSEANSQSGRSNSSDSLDSARASSLAKGHRGPPPPVAAARDPPAPASPPHHHAQQHDTLRSIKGTLTAEQPRTDPAPPRRKLSSIGIQVSASGLFRLGDPDMNLLSLGGGLGFLRRDWRMRFHEHLVVP